LIRDDLPLSLALGRYNIPPKAEGDDWSLSPIGSLLSDAKYGEVVDAEARLTRLVLNYAERQPILSRVGSICAVPSSNDEGRGLRPNLPAQWAAQLSEHLGASLIQLRRNRIVPSQKRIKGTKAALHANQVQSMIAPPVDDSPILLIDDLYGSGATVHEAYRALREGGVLSGRGQDSHIHGRAAI
jgi:predicted amidophosphoribosyltransferase